MTESQIEIDGEQYTGVDFEIVTKSREHSPFLTLSVTKTEYDGRFETVTIGDTGFQAESETVTPDSGTEIEVRGLETAASGLSKVTDIGQEVTILSDDVGWLDGERYVVVDADENGDLHTTKVDGERVDAYQFSITFEPLNDT